MIDWGEGKSFAAHPANCAWNEATRLSVIVKLHSGPDVFAKRYTGAHRVATRFMLASEVS
jgi:hypothetical protein